MKNITDSGDGNKKIERRGAEAQRFWKKFSLRLCASAFK